MEAKVKILFIDDDITFGRICTIILQEKGYEVFYQTTLNGAKACIAEAHPDIIVLDVEIGNQNGIEVAPEITVIAPNVPVLFISSHTESHWVVQALEAGAVAYLKKPFHAEELIAYVERFAVQRPSQLRIGSLSLDTETRILFADDSTVIKQLSESEYKLVRLLLIHKNHIVGRGQIEMELWGNTEGNEQSTNNLIFKIRKYLVADPDIALETIPRSGYRLSVKLEKQKRRVSDCF